MVKVELVMREGRPWLQTEDGELIENVKVEAMDLYFGSLSFSAELQSPPPEPSPGQGHGEGQGDGS